MPHAGRLERMNSRVFRSPRIRIVSSLVAASTALALVACSDDAPQGPRVAGPQVESLAVADIDAPRVTLIDAGVAPAQTIAFKDAAVAESSTGSETAPHDFTVKVSDGFSQKVMEAAAVETQAPAGGDVLSVTLPLRAATAPAEPPATAAPENPSSVQERPADRDVEIRIGQPSSSDPQYQEDLASAEGFLVGWRALNSGEQSTLRLGASESATEQGRALTEGMIMRMLSLPVVFPTEPVGPGAKWTVESRVTGESTLLQTTTFTLNSVAGDLVELDVDVQQRPAVSALDLSQAPGVATDPLAAEAQDGSTPAGQLVVTDSSTTSTGSLTIDLTQPLPVSGLVAWTTRVIYAGQDSPAQDDSAPTHREDIRIVQDTTTGLEFSRPQQR